MQKEKQCAYWFLTINNNAECYNDFKSIIEKLSLDYPKMEYSYIYHTIKENDDNVNENHIHCVIYFKQSVKRFTTMRNIFCGAHIELSNKQRYHRCIQYLIHKNDINKYQYPFESIITNIPIPILADILTGNGYEFELFDCTKLEEYIIDCLDSNTTNIYYFIKRFGIDTIKPYYFIIKDLLNQYKSSIIANYSNDDSIDSVYH